MKRLKWLIVLLMVCGAVSYGQSIGRVLYTAGVPGDGSPDCTQTKVVINSLNGDKYLSSGTPCTWTLSTPTTPVATGGTGATDAPTALANLGAATSIRSLPACSGTNIPCMVYAGAQSAAIGAVTVNLPSVINGVTCSTTPSSCVVRLTAVIHTTGVFTGSTPTVAVNLGAYNGFSTVTSATLDLTNTLRTISFTTAFLADVSAQQKFVYSTTFAGTPVGGTYELMILVE